MLAPFGASKMDSEKELFRALLEDGITITEQDLQKAKENEPSTLYKIGNIYYKNKNYHKSFAWFHKAATQDHADSQAQIGVMYERGEGVSIDYNQAVDWSMKAVSTGNATGQYNIGRLYFYGLGVSEDYKQAMNWYLQAANNGNIEAMNEIGWMYKYGKGVTKNILAAIEWYTKAVNQGNDWAQNRLGVIYQYEDEVKDLQKAVNWYQKAADNGDEDAKYYVNKLNEQGYYAKEEVKGILVTSAIKDTKHLTTVKVQDETIKDADATTSISNDQSQSFAVNEIDQQINNLIDKKMKAMEKMFQSKMHLMEVNMNDLKIEVVALKQEKREQRDEIKRIRKQLTQIEERIEDDANNDLNYDSPDNESNDGNVVN